MDDEFLGRKCAVIAHRGACIYAPQNTLPAFSKAFELGFSSFETDVHETKDNQLVVCHNYKIDNISDGIGKIADYTLEKLKSFDFGSYFSPEFKDVRIPTLDDLLILVKKLTQSGIINIEIKAPPSGETGIVDRVIWAVKNHGLFDRLLLSSFDKKILLRARQCDRSCRTALLFPSVSTIVPSFFVPPFYAAKELGVYSLHPHHAYITKAKIDIAHKLGFKVCPWTVNNAADIERCLMLGADGLITDYPGLCREMINKREIKKLRQLKK